MNELQVVTDQKGQVYEDKTAVLHSCKKMLCSFCRNAKKISGQIEGSGLARVLNIR